MAIEAVKQDWLARPEVAKLGDELGEYAAGSPLAECERLCEIVTDLAAARAFVSRLTDCMMWALRGKPLSEVPLRYKSSPGLSTVHLLSKGPAVLALSAYEPIEAECLPESVVLSDRSSAELVLSGVAQGLVHERAGEGVHSHRLRWSAGDRITTAPLTEARQVLRVDRTFVLLQLIRDARAPRPSEEICLAEGRVVGRASGDKSASQAVMALGVLGALQSTNAIEVMEQTLRNSQEDPEVRWESVRQVLSLDAARGMALLRELAACKADALSRPADQLAASLLRAYPALHFAQTEIA